MGEQEILQQSKMVGHIKPNRNNEENPSFATYHFAFAVLHWSIILLIDFPGLYNSCKTVKLLPRSTIPNR